MIEGEDRSVPVIVLLRGDSESGPITQPLQRLATITQTDFDSLWKEIGVDLRSWSPDIRDQPKNFPFPHLYAIQSYIDFEHQCHFDQVQALITEAKSAKNKIRSAGSERALDALIEIANRMTREGKGISFRPGLVSPPETHVIR
jgi:hypothetical protein